MLSRITMALTIALLACAFVPRPADAASFDCNKAATADEIAICGNPALGERDVEMATLYHVLTKMLAMGGRGAVQDDQRDWLAERAACGANVGCLSQRYADRIGQLNAALEDIYSRGPY